VLLSLRMDLGEVGGGLWAETLPIVQAVSGVQGVKDAVSHCFGQCSKDREEA